MKRHHFPLLVIFGILFFSFAMDLRVLADEPKTDIVFAEECTEKDIKKCPLIPFEDEEKAKYPGALYAGDTFRLIIFVKNLEKKNIVSVRSWLKYDPNVFKATEIEDKGSDFPLASPDGNEIDEENGQVKIGRGVAGGGKKDDILFVAMVEFSVVSQKAETADIAFVNFQKEELGETGVFILDESTLQPENVLGKEPRKLEFALNSGEKTQKTPSPNASQDTPLLDTKKPIDASPKSPEIGGPDNGSGSPVQDVVSSDVIQRPQGLRIQTTANEVNLVWKVSESSSVKGYYVYYSENSGFYIRRSDVGKTTTKTFSQTDLTKNKMYYFAITAYNEKGQESDYSDEVYVKFGVPETESHPFTFGAREGQKTDLTKNVTKLTSSGPEESVAISLGILGISSLIIYAYKKIRSSRDSS
ncbi:fibronectin type III domain-containing protein [Candidatus Peregrinibacteria bacterium]|nr:fibronectin type III domain-containing protein [Candidatus Peregrinibacteria bacterium]